MSKSQPKKSLTPPWNLPKLPEVPKGWDAWEYMGMHWDGFAHHYAFLAGGDWLGGAGRACGSAGHYFRAVRKPKPRRQPVPEGNSGVTATIVDFPDKSLENHEPHFVLPADGTSLKRMVDQGAKAIRKKYPNSEMDAVMLARAVLRSLGIKPLKKGLK